MEKSLSDQRGLLMEVPAFARIEHPKLVAQDILLGDVFTLGHNEEFMFARLSELPKLKERLNLLNAASDFVNMIGERVRSVDWMVMDSRHLAKNILEEKAKKLIKQEGEKTSRELGRDTRPLFGFESFELWNRQEEQDKRGNAEFLLESGEAFGRRTREEKLGSFAGRYAVHEWPHLNAFREVMNVETRTDESWGLVGRTLPAGKRHFIRVIDTNTIAQGTAFWQALGETVMLSILLGNWNFKPIDLSGIDGLELLTRNGVRPFMDPETEEVMLCMGTPRLSAQGYQRFVKKLLFKGRPDLPEQSLPGPQLVSAICGYLHKFIRKTAEDLKFPHKPQKYYEFYHGFSLCEDFIGYKAMINGMLKVLLKVAMLKDECLAVARRLDEKYGEERLIFERLIDAVFKIVDKFYWDSLAKRIFRRNWELKGLKVSAPWEKSSVLINNSDFIRSFDYRDHILSQRVILKGKPYRLLLGSFSAESADMVKAQLENEPDLAGIFIGQIFGTTNLEKTEKVGKIIRDKNLPVYLLPFGEAYSGGYSLFIAGSPAIAFYLKDFGFAETQMLGAHAWKSRSSGVRADQLPLDSPQHLPHIAYYEYLGLSPEKAREAYWLTVQAPHDSLHYFTHEDEKRLGLFKTQMLEPNKPIGEYLD
ncbi:MAG: hypothetical protein MI784_11515 [Cytophagales bacterium]|nr:hypothetical protein [Cytophagales bacterium]